MFALFLALACAAHSPTTSEVAGAASTSPAASSRPSTAEYPGVIVLGGLDKADVVRVVEAADFSACGVGGDGAPGALVARFTVDRLGRVGAAEVLTVDGSLASAGPCVVDRLRGLRFPAPSSQQAIVSWKFRAGG